MKTLFALVVAFAALAASAQTYVAPYIKQDGTLVQGHYKTTPNTTKADNYSSQGNSNPYTGQQGKVDPYAPKVCGINSNGQYVCK